MSVTTTPVASLDPLLVTVMAYSTGWPAYTGEVLQVFTADRSADQVTGEVIDELLLLLDGSLVVDETVAVLAMVAPV